MALVPRYFNVDRECVLGRSVNNLDQQIVRETRDQLAEEQRPTREGGYTSSGPQSPRLPLGITDDLYLDSLYSTLLLSRYGPNANLGFLPLFMFFFSSLSTLWSLSERVKRSSDG